MAKQEGRRTLSKAADANLTTQRTVGHGSEWLPGATHPKNDPPYHSSKFWYIGGILVKEVFSSNRLRILRKSIWGVVKWEGQNGTWTPLTEIAGIWVV